MAADNGKRKRRRVVRLRLEDDDEDVGCGKPPRRHQFKPGQSGNPKGRKKGVKNEITILQELLQHKVALNERGKTRKIILLEAILRRVAEDCLRGNIKCQSAFKFDPVSASNFDPFERRVLAVALAPSELVGVAETVRARAA